MFWTLAVPLMAVFLPAGIDGVEFQVVLPMFCTLAVPVIAVFFPTGMDGVEFHVVLPIFCTLAAAEPTIVLLVGCTINCEAPLAAVVPPALVPTIANCNSLGPLLKLTA